jgi:hypothetical protein
VLSLEGSRRRRRGAGDSAGRRAVEFVTCKTSHQANGRTEPGSVTDRPPLANGERLPAGGANAEELELGPLTPLHDAIPSRR